MIKREIDSGISLFGQIDQDVKKENHAYSLL